MSLLLCVHDVASGAAGLVRLLADPIDNPAPADPTNGSKGISLLLSYAK
ncbi:hypothetical protein SAMN04489712_105515 [Thermomonospora echinospora]|uniref:Uncharacterized protein n=1 Tax=Thermomonospora echinospora TaxID=1992 RepID=A0A1H6AKN6_9ACTN|nr:hypothetical protein [Thermomonospora echinospora]SEG49111.1 hypothetical protein SAMN04489712_105515 [Thermomonospora echinospora]